MHLMNNDVVSEMELDFIGKKARERRAAKKEARHERKKERIALRGEGKTARAGVIGNILNGAKNLIKGEAPVDDVNIDRSGVAIDFRDQAGIDAEDASKKQKQTLVIIGAIVVICLVAFVFLKMKSKTV